MSDDPFGDALAAQAQSGANADPYGDALAAQAASKPKNAEPSVLDKAIGAGEAGLSAASGGIASLVGGIDYLGNLPRGTDAAAAAQRYAQDTLTYQPRTEKGKEYSADLQNALSYGGQKGGEMAGPWVTEKLAGAGVPAEIAAGAGAAANTAYNVPQMLLGARFGEGIGKLEPEAETPKLTDNQALAQKAQEKGLVVPPTTTNPTILNKMVEGTAGKKSTAQLASIKNQPIFNQLAKQDLGLPQEAELTPETLAAVRNAQSPAYEAVKAIPSITLGPKYVSALGKLTESADQINKELPDLKLTGSDQVQKLVASLIPESGTLSGTTAVELSKQLRYEASSAASSPDPAVRMMARAYRGSATALENAIEDHLTSIGKPELADNWDNARRTIAKTYSIQDAIDGAGNVDASKLGKQAIKGKPLSDNLDLIADFANNFKNAANVKWSKESIPGISPLDIYGGSALGLASAMHTGEAGAYAAGVAVPLGRMGARSALLSKPGQRLALPMPQLPSIKYPLGQAAVTGIPTERVSE